MSLRLAQYNFKSILKCQICHTSLKLFVIACIFEKDNNLKIDMIVTFSKIVMHNVICIVSAHFSEMKTLYH